MAHAEPSFALSWRERPAPVACVTEAALRAVVAEKLGRDPFTDRERADVVIEGEEVSVGAGLRARVRERARDGTILGSREVDAESCPRLIRATGIVVALIAKPREDREPGEDRGGRGEDVVERDAPAEERVQTESPKRAPATPSSAPVRPPPRDGPAPGAPRGPLELSLGLGGSAAV
ncbi:MAG: hypothetical protein K0S65_4433, partial [Labilithrix sp.]|nr:hypothetical protein [Labilithrix sp.]